MMPPRQGSLRFCASSIVLCLSLFLLALLISPVAHVSGFAPPLDCNHPHHSTFQTITRERPFSSFQLFGIKGLRAWFDNQFPQAIVDINTAAPSKGSNYKYGKKRKQKNSASTTKSHTFDHVLIDMNQILHVTLRRSRSDEGLAIRLLMSELDNVLSVVTPRKSLVLAIDGPPAAAKLATQRRRRFSTLVRTEWKLRHFDKLRVSSKSQRARRLRGYHAELDSLQITPSTKFMKSMEETLLYWTWQRLQQRHSKFNRVRFYISPSSVAGEGEVKLLEWVLQRQSHFRADGAPNDTRADTVALLGRDSDLILEGLLLPPYYTTHNVFVVRQETSKHYSCVSLWETTLALQRWLPPEAPPNQILQIRTDLVLLLMINGNDYLPKLRGGQGFSKVCSIYREVLANYYDKNSKNVNNNSAAGLVNPDSLEFNLDFTIDFFQRIADMVPPEFWEASNNYSSKSYDRNTALGRLNNILEGGFVPRPLRFQILDDNESNDEDDGTSSNNDENVDRDGDDGGLEDAMREDYDYDVDDDDEDDAEEDYDYESEDDGPEDDEEYDDELDDELGLDEEPDYEDYDEEDGDGSNVRGTSEGYRETERELIRLTLGKPGSDDCLSYEDWKEPTEPFKVVKQRLAAIALKDFLGDESDEDGGDFKEVSGITSSGYAWEVTHAVEGKVETYLGGLLWNLQTYQDGICADYNYNYGKRMSPTSIDIVDFLKQARAENRTVGRRDLLGDEFSKPVSGGLSCLAALPSEVQHLVPEPYGSLPKENVERIYSLCMSAEDNSFDLNMFQELIDNEVETAKTNGKGDIKAEEDNEELNGLHGRRIILGDHYWTVIGKSEDRLTHPFDPPASPLEAFSSLRWNDRIRVSRMFALEAPESRAVWGYPSFGQEKKHHYRKPHRKVEIIHSGLGGLIQDKQSILDVPYHVAFRKGTSTKTPKKSKKNEKPIFPFIEEPAKDSTMAIVRTSDGQTAFACLKQLEDIGLIGKIEYTMTPLPGDRDLSEFHPEQARLSIRNGSKKCVIKNDLLFEQNREDTTHAKQLFKHRLASLALQEIIGPTRKWSDMSTTELKRYLTKSKAAKD